jgi:phosphatidylserine/phosphatidylglycerophosphate/cardiolipin synthase-like enzyme
MQVPRPAANRPPKFRYPWRTGNRFELLIDGRRFVPRLIEAVDGARREVLVEMYLFESGEVASRLIRALVDAARRGVTVRLLLDDFGALGLARADRERLRAAGAALAFYNPLRTAKLLRNFFRDHRKLVVVDGEVAYTGGTGITDEFDPPAHPERAWRETMLEIRGPAVRDWQALFFEVWRRLAPAPAALPSTGPAPAGASLGRVTATSGPIGQEIKRSLLKQVRRARTRVWISTAYFIPPWRIRRALGRAVRRGVDVRLLLPGPFTDHPAVRHAGRRFYQRLLRQGVRIFEYQPRFLHQKAILCDDWVSIGSANLDRWNLRWNLEANQEVNDPRFAQAVHAMLANDFRESVECRYEAWRRRPWTARLPEWLWGRVDLLLERFGRRRDDR